MPCQPIGRQVKFDVDVDVDVNFCNADSAFVKTSLRVWDVNEE